MIPAADRRNPPFLSFEESHLPNVFMPLEFVLVFGELPGKSKLLASSATLSPRHSRQAHMGVSDDL